MGPELAEKLANPLVFQWSSPGANAPPGPIHGYDVTILIAVNLTVFAVSGTRLSRFLSSETLADYVGPDLVKKIANPLVFQWPNVGPDAPPGPIHGYDVTILIAVNLTVFAVG